MSKKIQSATDAAARSKIIIERAYQASVEELWELWTTKEGFESWWGPEGFRADRTLAEPRRARTRISRTFDSDAVRRLKADAERDLTVDGPEVAAHALRAGLVDELQMIVCPLVVGGGKRFFPDGVCLGLDLIEKRRFRNGALVLRYAVGDT